MHQPQQAQGDHLQIEVQPCSPTQLVVLRSGLTDAQVRFHPEQSPYLISSAIDGIDALVMDADQLLQLKQFYATGNIKECKLKKINTIDCRRNDASRKFLDVLTLNPEMGEPIQIPVYGKLETEVTNTRSKKIIEITDGHVAKFEYKITCTHERKKRTDAVSLDHVVWIIFHAHVTKQFSNGHQQTKWIWVSSQWIKCYTHSSQMCETVVSYLWLKALNYNEPIVENEVIPQSVAWERLKCELDKLWSQSTGGRSLSTSEWNFLTTKFNTFDQLDGKFVTFYDFNVRPLPTENFSFWKWFYNTMLFTKENLCGLAQQKKGKHDDQRTGPWQEGCIAGFMSFEEACSLLEDLGIPETCILRFSETEVLGALSINYFGKDQDGSLKALCFQSFNEADLKAKNLIDRILDLEVLTHFYYNRPIAEELQRFRQRCDGDGGTPRSNLVRYIRTFLCISFSWRRRSSTTAAATGTEMVISVGTQTEPLFPLFESCDISLQSEDFFRFQPPISDIELPEYVQDMEFEAYEAEDFAINFDVV